MQACTSPGASCRCCACRTLPFTSRHGQDRPCERLNGMLIALDSPAAAQASTWANTHLKKMGHTIVGPWGVVVAGGEVQQGCLERADTQGSANAGEERWAGCSGVLQQQQHSNLRSLPDNTIIHRSAVKHTAQLGELSAQCYCFSVLRSVLKPQRPVLQLFLQSLLPLEQGAIVAEVAHSLPVCGRCHCAPQDMSMHSAHSPGSRPHRASPSRGRRPAPAASAWPAPMQALNRCTLLPVPEGLV